MTWRLAPVEVQPPVRARNKFDNINKLQKQDHERISRPNEQDDMATLHGTMLAAGSEALIYLFGPT